MGGRSCGKNAKAINKAYPVDWRAVHFPAMLNFVIFIIFPDSLVFASGTLRNLNHMYGGQMSSTRRDSGS